MAIGGGSSGGAGSEDIYFKMAENEILNTFGDSVSVLGKSKSLIKFGRNESIGTTPRTIMQFQGAGASEILPTANVIDRAVSTDATFASLVTIEGHTISGTDLTFVTQTVTMNGQTPVTLPIPMARANRIFTTNGPLATTSDKCFVYENTTVTSGVPDDTTKIHVLMDGLYNQSQKAQTALSQFDYWMVQLVYGGILKKQAAIADITMQIKAVGSSTWRTAFEYPTSSNGSDGFSLSYPPIYIIPKNHDVRLVGVASSADTEVVGGIAGYLASIQT